MQSEVDNSKSREDVLQAMYATLDGDNSLSRCCAVRALAQLEASDTVSARRLIELLRDPDADVRLDAANALGQPGFEAAIGPLVENLENDPDGDVRIQAVGALSRIHSEAVVEPLIRCFQEDGYPDLGLVVDDLEYNACWEVQSRALEALAKIGDQRAVGPLMELLEEVGYEDLQDRGYQVLAQLNSSEAQQFLLRQLQQGEPLARRRAALALTRPGESTPNPGELPAEVLNALTKALLDAEPNVRQYAARALGNTQNPLVAISLIMLLGDSSLEVRSEVAQILGKTRTDELLERLLPMLQDPDIETRRMIARILGEIGDPAAVAPLAALLDVQHSDLLYDVVAALGKIGGSGPRLKLAAILLDDNLHYTIRIEAARALASILREAGAAGEIAAGQSASTVDSVTEPERSPEQVLAASVFDEDQRVAYAALASLVAIEPDKASARLIGLLQQNQLAVDEEDLRTADHSSADKVEITGKAVPDSLQDLVKDHDAETSTLASILAAQPEPEPSIPENKAETQPVAGNSLRVLAARLLGGIAEPGSAAVDALLSACEDPEPELNREAITSLGRIRDERALPVLIRKLDASQSIIKLAAVDALGRFDRLAEAEQGLLLMLDDPDSYLRQQAVQALGAIQGPEAVKYVPRMLEDEDRDVCRQALSALTGEMKNDKLSDQIFSLIFKFSGELRTDAAATLRRLNDFQPVTRIMDILHDASQEEYHWMCIDSLAELYVKKSRNNNIEAENASFV